MACKVLILLGRKLVFLVCEILGLRAFVVAGYVGMGGFDSGLWGQASLEFVGSHGRIRLR
jgi:hypothetical protein